jgi:glycerol-3-phosphate dehydrogenase
MASVLRIAPVLFFVATLLLSVADLRAESAIQKGKTLAQELFGTKKLSESASKSKIKQERMLRKAVTKVNTLSNQWC